jgi:polysaccharide biosynthesis/export protein
MPSNYCGYRPGLPAPFLRQNRSTRRVRTVEESEVRRCVLLTPFVVGCVAVPPRPSPPGPPTVPGYTLGCPDVLAVRFNDRPGWDAVVTVDVDGTLPLGPAGRPRVQGLTVEAAAAAVAEETTAPRQAVSVEVLEPRSATVTVAGPVNGTVKAVVYRGPEPVAELLQRAGAIQPGTTNWHDVYLMRSNVSGGAKAELTAIDLEAALLDGKATPTVRPGDHVYVGSTRRASFARLLPNWLRPYYERLLRL